MNHKAPVIKVKEVESIAELATMRHSRNINELHADNLTLGDRIADKLADFAGSWTFIISFLSILFGWLLLNSIQLFFRPFDPFPFILMNLILSCIAALQAPVIMMSQNRQEKKDRLRAEHDYEINLKAEILIEEILKRLEKLENNQNQLLEKLSGLK
jgi:uncharacterized membrane protein